MSDGKPTWRVGMMTAQDALDSGGEWLKAARSWIRENLVDGDRVGFGGEDLLRERLRVRQAEYLAAVSAVAVINEVREAWRPLPYRLESGVIQLTLRDAVRVMAAIQLDIDPRAITVKTSREQESEARSTSEEMEIEAKLRAEALVTGILFSGTLLSLDLCREKAREIVIAMERAQ